jgi:hypothetical protein
MEMRSRSSLRALARMGFQKRRMAPGVWWWRWAQAAKDSCVSEGMRRRKWERARAMESLSAQENAAARRKAGRVWRGAGSGDGARVVRRPPGSM